MRILMISDVYFPRINGVSTSIQSFKNDIENMGHEVFLIAPEYGGPTAQDEKRIYRIHSRKVPLDPEDRFMKYGDIIALIPQLAALNVDLVHIHTPFVAHYAGVRIARELKLPIVVTYHTYFEEYLHHYIPLVPKKLLGLFSRHFSRAQCSQANHVIAPSSVIVELLKRYGVRIPITILPTGINCELFRDGDGRKFRERYGISAHRRVLLNVSRIAFEKNINLLLAAVNVARKQAPDLLLVIAGEGPARNAYVKLAGKLGLQDNVLFVGNLDRSTELVNCYHAADLFVFASKTKTQGLVLIEAMAAGTPVLSVAEMGTRDILVGCRGARITGTSCAEFAQDIVSLVMDDEGLQELASASISCAAKWDAAEMSRKLIALYQGMSNSAQVKKPSSIATSTAAEPISLASRESS